MWCTGKKGTNILGTKNRTMYLLFDLDMKGRRECRSPLVHRFKILVLEFFDVVSKAPWRSFY